MLWIALHLPLLPLEMFRPRWSAGTVAVVCERDRVMACSALACEAGIGPGMRRAGVQLLAPEALCYDRNPDGELQTLRQAALALLQYSPQLCIDREATILIEVAASLRLFGGIRRLCRRIRHTVRQLGLSAHLGCAPTARAAWLLAQSDSARRRTLSPQSMQRQLDTLPLHLLPAARPQREWLQGIGCHRLGQLRGLPRAGLQRRCGKALLDALDQAYGERPELFEWHVAPPTFAVRIELPDHVERSADLLPAAHHLLTQLCGWLAAGQWAVGGVALTLQHERGRAAIPPTRIDILLAEASWEESHLLRLLKERLERLELVAAAIGIGLAASSVETRAAPSMRLFPEAGGNPQSHRQLIELLAARLGAAHILQAAPVADHRPESANRWRPVLATDAPASVPAPCANDLPAGHASVPSRPAWLLPQAIQLSVRGHRPFYHCVLVPVSPPERIEAGWWSADPVTRDYFIAEGRDGAYYWIYRERADRDAAPHWYLHGLFA